MTATSTVDASRTRGGDHPTRIPALDGLRGLAVVAVVLYHGGHLEGGFLGVDLFFVLSGFLITSILVRGWASERRIDLGRFWSRRARRLLPALLAMVVIVVPVYAIWFATGTELTVMRRDGLSTLLYVTNWQQIHYGQVYGATGLVSPLRHAWSLAVEEQFYVVWPLLVVVLLRRRGPSLVRTIAPVLAVASALLTIVIAQAGTFSNNSLYLGTHSRAGALLAGATLAVWRGPRTRSRRARPDLRLEVAAVAALAVLVAMCIVVSVQDDALYSGGLLVSALCSTILVAAAAQPNPGPIVRVLTVAPLRWLGTTSYGIYLWSWPIMQMISAKHTPLDGWGLLAVQVAATLAAASASWYLLEKPILAGALRPPTGQRVLVGSVVAALVVVGIATAGAEPLISDRQSTAGYSSTDGSLPRLLVVGDSVPARIAEEGIAPLGDELGVSVIDRSVPGCILLREDGRVKGIEGDIRTDVTPCNDGWAPMVQELQPDIALVLFGQFANDQVELDGSFRSPCDPEYQAAERAALDAGIDDLTSDGARVVLATAPGSSVDWILEATPDVNEHMTCLNDLYTEVADERDDVDLLDFAPLACPEPGRCRDTIDGVNLREDTIHFQDEAAQLVARWMVPRILGTADGGVDPGALDPGRDPYCDTVDDFYRTVVGLVPGSTTSEGPLVTPELAAAIRGLDATELSAGAPPAVADAVQQLLAAREDLLARLADLPARPSETELVTAFGEAMTPATALSDWYRQACF